MQNSIIPTHSLTKTGLTVIHRLLDTFVTIYWNPIRSQSVRKKFIKKGIKCFVFGTFKETTTALSMVQGEKQLIERV